MTYFELIKSYTLEQMADFIEMLTNQPDTIDYQFCHGFCKVNCSQMDNCPMIGGNLIYKEWLNHEVEKEGSELI